MKRRSFQNIKLSYLFRDAGNYKTFVNVILRNASGKSAEEIDGGLRRFLIEDAYFYVEQVQLLVLKNSSNEGMWHEYQKVLGGEYKLKVRTICAAASLCSRFI